MTGREEPVTGKGSHILISINMKLQRKSCTHGERRLMAETQSKHVLSNFLDVPDFQMEPPWPLNHSNVSPLCNRDKQPTAWPERCDLFSVFWEEKGQLAQSSLSHICSSLDNIGFMDAKTVSDLCCSSCLSVRGPSSQLMVARGF